MKVVCLAIIRAGLGMIAFAIACNAGSQARAAVPMRNTQAVSTAGDDSWRSTENYPRADVDISSKKNKHDNYKDASDAERIAIVRRSLQPPMLPQPLVADYEAKTSPKAHWGDGDEAVLEGNGLAEKPRRAKPSVPLSQKTVATVISSYARETLAMMEAFKTALRETGGAEKFKSAALATPYLDR